MFSRFINNFMKRIRDKETQAQYARDHYHRNKDKIKARAKENTLKTRRVVREYILQYLLENPCIDCGNSNPIVLEFDHRGDKLFAIGMAINMGYSLKKVKTEIEKCDVRCANCHRIKTYNERGFIHKNIE